MKCGQKVCEGEARPALKVKAPGIFLNVFREALGKVLVGFVVIH